MIDIADITQRNALDQARADGRREALAEVLKAIDALHGNPLYRKAWKRVAIEVSNLIKSVKHPITQA